VLDTPNSSATSQNESLLDRILDKESEDSPQDVNPALWMRMSDGDEYTGPSSGIAPISDLGLSWMRENLPDSHVLCKTIQDIRNAMLCHLRQPKCTSKDIPVVLTSPRSLQNLPHSRLMAYVDAYFSTVQAIFPILDRPRFLSQLATMGTDLNGSSNYSWYALLNAVLASGCRATLSNETAEAFKISGRESWTYFQNARAFESRILHSATDLLGVQAMAVMTVFTQGLSSPLRLEYTFSSITSRMAQSLGLDRRAPPEWNLAEEEVRERNRVFWAVFNMDKMIALRCGRPSVICDDDVSCYFPRNVELIQQQHDLATSSSSIQPLAFDYFLCITKLSRLCGRVSRSLYSAAALDTLSSRLITTANRILHDLQTWLVMIPPEIHPSKPLNRMTNMCGLSREQVVVAHASYYDVLGAIYRRFTPLFTKDSHRLWRLIDPGSHPSYVEAARSSVLLTKHLDMESFTPGWYVNVNSVLDPSSHCMPCTIRKHELTIPRRCDRLVFYYPFAAFTAIFFHTVSNPPDESTQGDIALMEMVVGFFGRLEYVTSGEAAFTTTTEFVRHARSMTRRRGNAEFSRRHPDTSLEPDVEYSLQEQQSSQAEGSDNHVLMPVPLFDDGAAQNAPAAVPEPGPRMPEGRAHGIGQSPWPGRANDDVAMAKQGPLLYSELASLLGSPPGDTSPAQWLTDWDLNM
jgi:hypothetical protein